MQLRTESSVDAKELLVHDRSEGKGTERFHAGFIDSLRVLVLALELEGEIVGEMATLMVSAQQPESLGIMYLQGPQVQDTLDTKVAPVYVVAEEEISGLGRVTTDFEKFHKIVILTMNITTNCYRSVHLEKVGLCA